LWGRTSNEPEDVHRVAFPALRHRLLLNFHGQAEGVPTDRVIGTILEAMPDGLYQPPAPPAPSRARARGFLRRFFG
jgi:MoxR-like ATPase